VIGLQRENYEAETEKTADNLQHVAAVVDGRLATCTTDDPFTSRRYTPPCDRPTAKRPAKSMPGFHAKSIISSPIPS